MIEYSLKIKIPLWLDVALAGPVLLYRLLRYGYTFRRIPLTRGLYAIVDAQDYHRLRQRKWQVQTGTCTYYATSTVFIKGKRRRIWMHRCLLNPPQGKVIDHINGNGLDNRRANLRVCTYAQNCCNRRLPATAASIYRGVTKSRTPDRPWLASIYVNYKKIKIGTYLSEIEAAKAYDRTARRYRGAFARANFPDECEKQGKNSKLNLTACIRRLRILPPRDKHSV